MNLANKLINGFLHSEIELFKKDFDIEMVPEIQDIRGLAIAWVCFHFNDIIDKENRSDIEHFVYKIYHSHNFDFHGWYRIVSLESAAFILTDIQFFADSLISRVSCGQSWARPHIIECAGVICPLISFHNSHLRKSAESNIKNAQANWENSTILYLNTKGPAAEKKEWLKKQSINCFKDQKEFFQKLLEGDRFCPSSFFVSAYTQAKSYFIFKIMSNPILRKTEQTLFDHMPYDFETLMKQEKQHPLSGAYTDFSFLKE